MLCVLYLNIHSIHTQLSFHINSYLPLYHHCYLCVNMVVLIVTHKTTRSQGIEISTYLTITSSPWHYVQVCSDSLSAIQNIQKCSHLYSYRIQKLAATLYDKSVHLHIAWLPGHMSNFGSEIAYLAARKAADLVDSSNFGVSHSYLKRNIKIACLQKWKNLFAISFKGQAYQNLHNEPVWKSFNFAVKTSRVVWSAYMQLKLGYR